jgi:hypothetical protein
MIETAGFPLSRQRGARIVIAVLTCASYDYMRKVLLALDARIKELIGESVRQNQTSWHSHAHRPFLPNASTTVHKSRTKR